METGREFELDRMIQIWQWLLYPDHNDRPNNLQPEELVSVFCRNALLLQNFDKLLKGAAELHSLLDRRKSASSQDRQ